MLLQGYRNKTDGLWDLQVNRVHTNGKNKMNYIITKDKSKLDLAQYIYASLFSPATSTLQ